MMFTERLVQSPDICEHQIFLYEALQETVYIWRPQFGKIIAPLFVYDEPTQIVIPNIPFFIQKLDNFLNWAHLNFPFFLS